MQKLALLYPSMLRECNGTARIKVARKSAYGDSNPPRQRANMSVGDSNPPQTPSRAISNGYETQWTVVPVEHTVERW